MKKTDNKKLIIFAFFLKKLITDDFCKNVYPNKKKTYASHNNGMSTVLA